MLNCSDAKTCFSMRFSKRFSNIPPFCRVDTFFSGRFHSTDSFNTAICSYFESLSYIQVSWLSKKILARARGPKAPRASISLFYSNYRRCRVGIATLLLDSTLIKCLWVFKVYLEPLKPLLLPIRANLWIYMTGSDVIIVKITLFIEISS